MNYGFFTLISFGKLIQGVLFENCRKKLAFALKRHSFGYLMVKLNCVSELVNLEHEPTTEKCLQSLKIKNILSLLKQFLALPIWGL